MNLKCTRYAMVIRRRCTRMVARRTGKPPPSSNGKYSDDFLHFCRNRRIVGQIPWQECSVCCLSSLWSLGLTMHVRLVVLVVVAWHFSDKLMDNSIPSNFEIQRRSRWTDSPPLWNACSFKVIIVCHLSSLSSQQQQHQARSMTLAGTSKGQFCS